MACRDLQRVLLKGWHNLPAPNDRQDRDVRSDGRDRRNRNDRQLDFGSRAGRAHRNQIADGNGNVRDADADTTGRAVLEK